MQATSEMFQSAFDFWKEVEKRGEDCVRCCNAIQIKGKSIEAFDFFEFSSRAVVSVLGVGGFFTVSVSEKCVPHRQF